MAEPEPAPEQSDQAAEEPVFGWTAARAKLLEGTKKAFQHAEGWLTEHKHVMQACAIFVALWVGVINCRTYNEILYQTRLQAAHARGTEAARVNCAIGPFGDGGPDITLTNSGLLDARDITIKYEFQLVSIPSFAVQSPAVKGSFHESFVRAQDRLNPNAVQKSVAMPGYTQATIDEILAGRLGLLIKWNGSYNDGLDNLVQFPATCAYWLKYQPEPTMPGLSENINCDEAKTRLDNAHKNYELFLKKKAEQQPPKPK